ncbi:MAG: CRISPR-associated helicase Cas3' [Candidatus Heimdallarchaeota archaeon]
MSSSSELFSHPNILLSTHLQRVSEVSREILREKVFSNKALLTDISVLIAYAHDFAKSTSFFQQKLFEKGEKTLKSQHSKLSAIFGYYLIQHYLRETKQLAQNEFLPIMGFIAIACHHGNIANLYSEKSFYNKFFQNYPLTLIQEQMHAINLSVVIDIYKTLLKDFESINIKELLESFYQKITEGKSIDEIPFLSEIKQDFKKLNRKRSLENYFLIELLFSVLIDADKIVASGAPVPPRIETIPPTIIEMFKQKEFATAKEAIDLLREKAFKVAIKSIEEYDVQNDSHILDLILPTGCGKTLTALACAMKLREKVKKAYAGSFTPKIIYSLPFLSIIDQNSSIIEKIFVNGGLAEKIENIPNNLFLKHHHLAETAFNFKKENEYQELPIHQALLLTESWHAEFVITTFVQFFHSLISNRNRSSRKFHNIINSIIILDEIQALPQKYWSLINAMLNFLTQHFHCWVILLTATKPLIFSPEETKSLIEYPEDYYSFFNRMTFKANLTPVTLEKFKTQLLQEIRQTKKDIMVVLNTVRSCREVYQYIKSALEAEREGNITAEGIWESEQEELYYLSTHVIPLHRLKKIKKIRKKSAKRKIIITTQLVEAGVDISVDKIYRDFAPLDSIIQAAGRCNRHNQKEKGEVEIIILTNEKGRKYHKYIYDATLTTITEKILEELFEKDPAKRLDEETFTLHAINDYFQRVKIRTSEQISQELLEKVEQLRFDDLGEFQLIKEQVSLPIFVELDEKAREIRRAYEEELEQTKGFQKKLVRRKYRKKLNDYTINIRATREELTTIRALPNIGESSYMFFIPEEFQEKWYAIDVGFSPEEGSHQELRFL